jgi:hypothetical protein
MGTNAILILILNISIQERIPRKEKTQVIFLLPPFNKQGWEGGNCSDSPSIFAKKESFRPLSWKGQILSTIYNINIAANNQQTTTNNQQPTTNDND